jgi:glycosyltransferase involved in cell wall biosynthesis
VSYVPMCFKKKTYLFNYYPLFMVSVIVSFYKKIKNLDLILRGLSQQSFQDFELIVAEDNDAQETISFLEEARKKYAFPIKHVSQPDNGFQKCRILNKAIALSSADYLVFFDDDCVPHHHFLKAHFKNRKEKTLLFGRRVMLSDKLTERLYENPNLSTLNIFNLILTNCKSISYAFYLPFLHDKKQRETGMWGCNWSIHKKDIEAVNGFDEDFKTYGIGEDTDIEWRLLATGVRLKNIKFQALQYHLSHPQNSSDVKENIEKMNQKKAMNQVVAINGLSNHPYNS